LTYIGNIMQKMIRPTDEMKKLFAELGVSSAEMGIATYTLSGFLSILEQRTRGSSTETAKLFHNIRAIRGVLGVTGHGLSIYQDHLEQIADSLEDYNKAFDIVMQNPGKRLEVQLQKIRNFFTVDIVDNFLRRLSELTNGFDGLAEATKTLVGLV